MCKYCDGTINDRDCLFDVDDIRIYIGGSSLLFLDSEEYNIDENFEINYCPMCGKKLGED